jgi:hypothetical protein
MVLISSYFCKRFICKYLQFVSGHENKVSSPLYCAHRAPQQASSHQVTWNYLSRLYLGSAEGCRRIKLNILFLWFYSPILDLSRLHETSRFISVTRSRTVSRTPWLGDQLVARHLLTSPGDCDDDGEVCGMNGFGRGNQSTRRKPSPTPLCPHKSHFPDPGTNPGRRCGKPAISRFSYGAAKT